MLWFFCNSSDFGLVLLSSEPFKIVEYLLWLHVALLFVKYLEDATNPSKDSSSEEG